MTKPPTSRTLALRPINRRRLLEGVVAGGLGLQLSPVLAKVDDPRKLPPQIGDEIVYPSWENDGRAVTIDDVPLGGPPMLAYPRDPASGVAREKSRLNQLLLIRFGEDEISENTKPMTVAGVVAYSGVCTHTGCSVTEWDAQARHFLCPCHASQFDPRELAQVIGGPAPRPLPALALARAGEALTVAAPFSARVGAKKK